MLGRGAAKAKDAAKAVGGIGGKAPVLDLLALAARPAAVAKPKGDAKRKAVPKCGVAKPAGKAKRATKGKAPVGSAAPLRVVWPVAHPFCLHLCVFASTRVPGAAPAPAVAFHRDLHPDGFPPQHPWNWVQVYLLWRLFRLPRQISTAMRHGGFTGPLDSMSCTCSQPR